MAHYAITIGSEIYIASGWDQAEAEENLAAELGVTELEFYDSIRPATVRETMANEYGWRWSVEDYRSGVSHVATFFEGNYNTDYKDLLIVNHTHDNAAHGYDDPVEVSNYRVLYDAWSHLEGLSRGPWSNVDAIALDLDSEAPADLVEVLNGLADCPVIDEQAWSNVEQEMIEEHWTSYGKSDALDSVAKAIGADYGSDLTEYAEELVTVLVWEGVVDYGHGGGYPEMVDSSYVNFGDAEVAAWVKAHLGLVVPVTTGYGQTRTFAVLPANLIRK